jgi:GDP-L-fucose synthase
MRSESTFQQFRVDLPDNLASAISGKSVLVTGGTGMIGREVVRILLDHGALVTSVSLDNLSLDSRAKYLVGDLSNLELCLDLTNGVDMVFHVAGIKGSVVVTKEKPASFFVPLLMMNTNVLEAARRNKVKKLVYTSSVGAYAPAEVFVEAEDDLSKPPMDMFPGWAKRMAELQIEAYSIQYGLSDFSIVRPSNIYGPGDNFDDQNAMVIPSLISRITRGDNPVVVWGDGTSERDFLHATDAAIGTIKACILGTRSRALNIGFGRGISILELVKTLQSLTEFEVYFDLSKPGGFHRRIMDITASRQQIGFEPSISLLSGLGQTLAWFRDNREEFEKKQNYFDKDCA